MREPCKSCPERLKDFGGCRCQAYMLTGDATNADPVCSLSPHHDAVIDAIERAHKAADPAHSKPIPLVFRNPKNSKTLIAEGSRKS